MIRLAAADEPPSNATRTEGEQAAEQAGRSRIPLAFETFRYALLTIGIFFAYFMGNGDPERTLHFLALFIIIPVAGLTGIEGMFFGRQGAQAMGREASTEYQMQSAGGNLAYAVTALIVFFAGWGVYADATILIATLLFFVFSGAVHLWGAIALGNKTRKNIIRPLISALLVGVCVWPLVASLTWQPPRESKHGARSQEPPPAGTVRD
jgi:hypothetical protein